jgi:hypothetical protein
LPVGDIPFQDVFDMDAPPPRPAIADGPVAVALCHDEMLRLPDWLRHHRQIGIRHFIVVDNASTDGSGAFLDAQPDVTRLFTAKPYQKFKAVFRAWPADNYADGLWITEPDIDEHLVYPGWPDVSLKPLMRHWEGEGYDGVFAPMVDMYAGGPLSDVLADPDARLVDLYPYFDAEGYWIAPPKRRTLARSPTPHALLYGGARTRFGGRHARLSKALVRAVANHRNPAHPRPGARLLHRCLVRGREAIGMKSKIALIRWQRGLSFPGSNHRVNGRLRLAPDWIALLHFRMMTDYAARERMWRARKGREASAEAEKLASVDPIWEGSRRLDSWRDLLDAGLMRLSPELARALALEG